MFDPHYVPFNFSAKSMVSLLLLGGVSLHDIVFNISVADHGYIYIYMCVCVCVCVCVFVCVYLQFII